MPFPKPVKTIKVYPDIECSCGFNTKPNIELCFCKAGYIRYEKIPTYGEEIMSMIKPYIKTKPKKVNLDDIIEL